MRTKRAGNGNGDATSIIDRGRGIAEPVEVIRIAPIDMRTIQVRVVGTAPLCVQKFSEKNIREMTTRLEAGATKARQKKGARDLAADYEHAIYRAAPGKDDKGGWPGFPSGGLRSAMIRACKAAGFAMTDAKGAVFVEPDGYAVGSSTPLVRIGGEMRRLDAPMRNDNGGVDIRVRPIWDEWHMDLRIRFDAGVFDAESVVNLLARAGMTVGIGEGRPQSRKSTGCNWGLFRIENAE